MWCNVYCERNSPLDAVSLKSSLKLSLCTRCMNHNYVCISCFLMFCSSLPSFNPLITRWRVGINGDLCHVIFSVVSVILHALLVWTCACHRLYVMVMNQTPSDSDAMICHSYFDSYSIQVVWSSTATGDVAVCPSTYLQNCSNI